MKQVWKALADGFMQPLKDIRAIYRWITNMGRK